MMERKARAKLRPICELTGIWLMPSNWYSTGSSPLLFSPNHCPCLIKLHTTSSFSSSQSAPRAIRAQCGRLNRCEKSSRCFCQLPCSLNLAERFPCPTAGEQLLSVDSGECRYSQIELVPLDTHHDSAVLGEPTLCNIQISQQL